MSLKTKQKPPNTDHLNSLKPMPGFPFSSGSENIKALLYLHTFKNDLFSWRHKIYGNGQLTTNDENSKS